MPEQTGISFFMLYDQASLASTPPTEYLGYLQSAWAYQTARYASNWRMYTGEAWLELEKAKNGQASSRKYRLGVNDIALACNMHSQLLFGEVKDTSDPLIGFRVASRKGYDAPDGVVERSQDFLEELWMESEGRKIQFLAGLSSQVTGGVYLRVRYSAELEGPFDLFPFKFEFLHSDYVFPVYSPGSTKFGEVFVRYQLPREAARQEWGVWSDQWPELVEYREHWTAAKGGMAGTLSITIGVEGSRKPVKAEKNPFGFVPFVYIPHVSSSGFFGTPLAEWAGGIDLSYEYNERLANVGDILEQNSYPFGVMKGHPNGKVKPPFRLWRNGPAVVDIGPAAPDGKLPEIDWYTPSDVSAGSMQYMDMLKKELRMSMAIPPVAVGEDEGSQRSSLTLVTRMFPFKSHVVTERWLWTPSFEMINRMALQMAKLKGVAKLDDIDVSKLSVIPSWAPMLPRDRAELVNELVMRQGVGHIDIQTALEQYEDIPSGEIEDVLKRIQEYKEWEAEINKPDIQPVEEGDSSDKKKEGKKKE